MKWLVQWWALLWRKPAPVIVPVKAPDFPPIAKTDLEEMIQRQNSPEMQQWLRPWTGNGVPRGIFGKVGPAPLYDHPHSRPATLQPCAECRFPDFGWGKYDHYPECSKHYGNVSTIGP